MVPWSKQKKAAFYYGEMLKFPRVEGKSRKYLIFEHPAGKYYYVGKKGAIRVGKSISDTVSITDFRLPQIEKEVDEYLRKNPEMKTKYRI